MALNRYVMTATVVVPAGTITTPSAGFGLWPQTFISGTAIVLDPAGPLFAAIGAGNLRLFTQGTDDAGHAALSN